MLGETRAPPKHVAALPLSLLFAKRSLPRLRTSLAGSCRALLLSPGASAHMP